MSASKRRKFTPEFKAEAVKFVLDQGLTRSQAARDLGIAESALCRWVQAQVESSKSGSLGDGDRAELKRLRRENATLRKEREVLKKAAAFFAKETL